MKYPASLAKLAVDTQQVRRYINNERPATIVEMASGLNLTAHRVQQCLEELRDDPTVLAPVKEHGRWNLLGVGEHDPLLGALRPLLIEMMKIVEPSTEGPRTTPVPAMAYGVPAPALSAPRSTDGLKAFSAKFDGTCHQCESPYKIGDTVWGRKLDKWYISCDTCGTGHYDAHR